MASEVKYKKRWWKFVCRQQFI